MGNLINIRQITVNSNFQLVKKTIIIMLAILCSGKAFSNEMRVIDNTSINQNTVKTILDIQAGLEWQHQGNKAANWTGAKAYCEKLVIGNKSDWRLPSIKELVSITNYSKGPPAVNEYFFTATADSEYWSSTQFLESQSHVWYMNFRFGDLYFADMNMFFFIRCVRDSRVQNQAKIQDVLPFPKK